jgi:hypothetical protein
MATMTVSIYQDSIRSQCSSTTKAELTVRDVQVMITPKIFDFGESATQIIKFTLEMNTTSLDEPELEFRLRMITERYHWNYFLGDGIPYPKNQTIKEFTVKTNMHHNTLARLDVMHSSMRQLCHPFGSIVFRIPSTYTLIQEDDSIISE